MAFHDNTAHARRNIGTESAGNWVLVFLFFDPGCGGLRGPTKPAGDIGDKLGSVMPAVNVPSPNLKRTVPSVRSKTD